MIAFRVEINGEQKCIASGDGAVIVSAIAHGKNIHSEQALDTLSVQGTTAEHTVSTWLSHALVTGDKITIEVVEVPDSDVTEPLSVTHFPPDIAERKQRAFYDRLKQQYEPESI